MQLGFQNGITSVVLRVKLRKLSDGTSYTGLDHTSSGLIIAATADNEQGPAAGSGAGFGVAYTVAGSTIETITTLGTFAAPTATKCRFKAVDGTNHPGLYEIQIADARWAVSNARSVNVTICGVSDIEQVDTVIQLGDATRGFMSPTNAHVWTTALTEAYRATGATGTGAQLLYEILQNLTEFANSGTTKTVKKLDGSTTAKTYTYDSASAPTSITETT